MSITKLKKITLSSGGTENVTFDTPIINSAVALMGFKMTFKKGDHHIRNITASSRITNFGSNNIGVAGEAYMEDNSSNKTDGQLDILVLAECYNEPS